MIGAIAGDIIGSYWEFRDEKDRDTELFLPDSTITDDSILSVATAESILRNQHYADMYRKYCRAYPTYGYGGSFVEWAQVSPNYCTPNSSYGNGSAMRVGPIGWAFDSIQRTMMEAHQSASVTHMHPEGIKGAQAIASAIFMARTGMDRESIRLAIEEWFEYQTVFDFDVLHEEYTFTPTCQGTVPVALACVFQADSFEETMRLGLHAGGDVDTLLAIAGSVAEPLYGIPEDIRSQSEAMLMKHSPALLGMLLEFERQYGCGKVVKSKQSPRFEGFFTRFLKKAVR
ncbi:ADP-ribosylglycohydrolase family protein [Pseudomonas taiwanensis]|uniref:ADP-ribosylglycohydrolase family protein n=1 Tax=Pseudomonas taiwanensis TaxID=470150 RepID=UPI0028DD616B|nr:ADP-ribosylglycohydrolase family protein [Pseudomonas taiwanensis]MDT8925432.1 ADP-ribosylglycohydrolase family protein [Pseudomonas taiwanensis]